ncbi:MAG: radical SAM protein [Bacteroidetes bacterium RIFCSPLOWO2_02_FULL_36_8]|nr:MAG: radical SAM protein [Bacteroidetes bacterium RIFCSPLOWO2_02_FULL_36_8]OFY72250.1 MAG: radical SAM protein [Bacteroidetes bacterium RIFCSPLOWO2_12_FULL_37_12]
MEVKEINAKNIIVKSKLPSADYVINPYTGCAFACIYCYASFMGRFVNQTIENWGNYVYVKINSIELFKNEINTFLKSKDNPSFLLSSVTDPYQGAEAKYKLTQGILEIIAQVQYKGQVGILTKSPMVLRDIEILKRIPNAEVGMTITSTEDKVSKWAEIKAPRISQRLEALKTLKENGIKTYAFVGPIFPHYIKKLYEFESIFQSLADIKVDSIFIEHINLGKYILKRMTSQLAEENQEIKNVYQQATTKEHRLQLDEFCKEMIKKYGLNLRLSEVIYHKN